MHSPFADSGETDRQMVLIHVDNTLLAMRTSNRMNRRKGGADDEMEGSEYAAAQSLLDLQRRLFAGAVPVPGPTSSSSPIRQHEATSPAACSSSAALRGFRSTFTDPPAQMLPLSSAAHNEVSEVTILSAFANVCRSPSTSAVVTGVALTALVDMLDLPCGFISTYGVHTAIEAASDTRAEVNDNGSHEVLLSRIFSVYVAALNHPAAAFAEGDVHVRAIGRMMVLATLPEASQLLKRSVEKCMRSIVMTLFRRLLYTPADEAERAAVVSAGTVVLEFISRLISGEIASFDNDGNEVAATTMLGSEVSNGGNGGGSGGGGASGGDEKESPAERSISLVQLEGLALAQDCLLLLRCSLDSPACAPLLDTVQNQLCRSLLIAGLGTTRSIVLSQVLRTVHLVMQGASEHLIPQIYNFIRVLHLNPLEALTNELSDAGPGSSPASANAPAGSMSPASPASNNSGNAFTRLSRTQLQRKQERRDILLDSLAEFCSDPRFGSFCFIHYDLSWRYSSLLPQLCQVLVNNAYPMGREDDTMNKFDRAGGRSGGGGSGHRGGGDDGSGGRQQRGATARGAGSVSRTSAGQLLQRTQRTALDAATNMMSGIALRAIDAGASAAAVAADAPAAAAALCEKGGADADAEAPPSATSELQLLTQQALKEKETLNQFAALFEDSPMKKGIPFLLEHAVRVPRGTEEAATLEHRTQLVLAEPAGGCEIGEALYRLSIILNKRVLGDYIGEQGRDKSGDSAASPTSQDVAAVPVVAAFSVRFFEEQLVGFIHQFQFHNKPLLTAIREMVYLLCLPGESQKIDRVMEAFAKHWYEQNLTRLGDGEIVKDESVNPFHSETGAFVLSFAIIMLNTDQHSGKVAHQMKKDDFVKMNRGIDEGKDVPADYLGRVYDDVRQHEVVMADMMDRGFGNDTTWRLEMRPCTSFLQIALSDKTAHAQEDAMAVESLASMSSHELASARTTDRQAVLHTFDPFLFRSLWKRSLLVFDGMLESAVAAVSQATEARGKSLGEAVADVQLRMPVEMSVLQSSLRGVSMLARAAHALGLPAVADQCLLGLLQHVLMDLSDADREVRRLYSSVPKMLCLTEVFALLVDIHSSMKDSWMPLARLILDMQLMGLFVPAGEKASPPSSSSQHRRGSRTSEGAHAGGGEDSRQASKDAPPSSSAATAAADSSGPLAVLLHDPGICASVFAPLSNTASSAEQQDGGEKGWFSSFFGGSGAPQIPERELNELREARMRLRSCVPDMRGLLSLLRFVAADPVHGHRCVISLCAASSIGGGAATPHTHHNPEGSNKAATGGDGSSVVDCVSEAAAYAASYELSLVCAVVGGASTPDVLQPDHLAPLTSRISRLLTEVGVYLADPRAGDHVRQYWCSVGSRLVEASVQLMTAHWRGQEGAMAVEQLWTCWMRAAPPVFTAIVAQPVSSFLHQVSAADAARRATALAGKGIAEEEEVDEEAAAVLHMRRPALHEPVAPWSSGSEMLVLLAPFATHAAMTTDRLVQRRVTAILMNVVEGGQYSVEDDTESIVSLCLSFSVWAREGLESGSSSTARSGGSGGARGSGRDEPAPTTPKGASVAEILSLCGRNVLVANAGRNPHAANTPVPENAGGWYGQWVFVLRSLGALALCSPEARDGSEALLCLQRALLDSEARALPASAVVAVYNDILIPLTERLCVPKAKVQAGLRWSATGGVGSGGGEEKSANGSDSNSNSNSNSAKRSRLGGLFNSLLAPASANGEELSGTAAPSPSSASRRSPQASPAASSLVSTEVKCRLLSLVPKVLLRYTTALTANQDVLLSLWRQVLGTLYAVYSAYPAVGTASDNASHDEAMLVQEAVEETVKNMIYVMAATWKDPAAPPTLAQETAFFWTAIYQLVLPFPFSGPLMDFMAAERLVEVAAAVPAVEQPDTDVV